MDIEKFTNRPRRYMEVSNRYSQNIKFVDKSEIDFDSVNLIQKIDREIFSKIFKKIFSKI